MFRVSGLAFRVYGQYGFYSRIYGFRGITKKILEKDPPRTGTYDPLRTRVWETRHLEPRSDPYTPETLNPETLNPETLNPETRNPETLNLETLNPKP